MRVTGRQKARAGGGQAFGLHDDEVLLAEPWLGQPLTGHGLLAQVPRVHGGEEGLVAAAGPKLVLLHEQGKDAVGPGDSGVARQRLGASLGRGLPPPCRTARARVASAVHPSVLFHLPIPLSLHPSLPSPPAVKGKALPTARG